MRITCELCGGEDFILIPYLASKNVVLTQLMCVNDHKDELIAEQEAEVQLPW